MKKCPRDQTPLTTVEDSDVEVDVCSTCSGEWLDAGEMQQLIQHHDEVFTPEESATLDGMNKEVFSAEYSNHDELNCPVCDGVQMEHFNYGETSGIILHKCPQCNGIWADKDELRKIEMLNDGWKKSLGQDIATYGPLLQKIELQEEANLDRDVSISRFSFVNRILRRFCEV